MGGNQVEWKRLSHIPIFGAWPRRLVQAKNNTELIIHDVDNASEVRGSSQTLSPSPFSHVSLRRCMRLRDPDKLDSKYNTEIANTLQAENLFQ